MAFRKAVLKRGSKRAEAQGANLLGAGVLGHSLGAFADGVFGQLAGEKQPDGGLDFPGGDGAPLVVVGQSRGFGGDALEDVVDETVHDGHGLRGDTGVGVDLLQHLVDVDCVALLPPALLLLVTLGDVLLGLAGLLDGFSAGFGRHLESASRSESAVPLTYLLTCDLSAGVCCGCFMARRPSSAPGCGNLGWISGHHCHHCHGRGR